MGQQDSSSEESVQDATAGSATTEAAEETAAPSGGKHAGDRVDEHEDADDGAATDEDPSEDDEPESAFDPAEHDPAKHDVEAGEEFRQRGDWVADDDEDPQVIEGTGQMGGPDRVVSGPGSEDEDSGEAGNDDGSDAAEGSAPAEGAGESSLEEVRDGGYGVGSAAPVGAGVVPLGHPVKAWHDTMTHVLPGQDGYEGSEPDVWFTDAEAAQAAGFRPAHD